MEITLKDRGEFLRGFLVLVKKNKEISEFDKNMTMVVGKYFGFAEDFCKEALKNLMENEYISEEPPKFSNPVIAEYFLVEVYRILKQLHPLEHNEEHWFAKTAEVNQVGDVTKKLNVILD